MKEDLTSGKGETMAYKQLCDICGQEIHEVYFDPRKFKYKRRIFGTYETIDICQECAEEMEKYIKERRINEHNN